MKRRQRSPLAWLERAPQWARWGGLVALGALFAFGVWFFLLRGGGGGVVPAPPPPRPALGTVVQFPDYRQAVETALGEVRAARSASDDERTKAAGRAASALDRVEGATVALPGSPANGRGSAEIDNTRLLSELRAAEPDLEAAESALASLGAALDGANAASLAGTLDGGRAQAELRAVLSEAVFDYTRTESPLQRLARWLAGQSGAADPSDTLWRLFIAIVAGLSVGGVTFMATDRIRNRWARLGIATAAGLVAGLIFWYGLEALDITFRVLTVAGLLVAVVAVAVFVGGLYRASAPGTPKRQSDLAAVLGMTATQARASAVEAAQAGNYRSALRYRCLAVLLALDEAGMLAFDRSATNREYLFRAPEGIHDDLQPLLTRFDEVWYGDEPTDADEWARYDAAAASIEARVAQAKRPQAA